MLVMFLLITACATNNTNISNYKPPCDYQKDKDCFALPAELFNQKIGKNSQLPPSPEKQKTRMHIAEENCEKGIEEKGVDNFNSSPCMWVTSTVIYENNIKQPRKKIQNAFNLFEQDCKNGNLQGCYKQAVLISMSIVKQKNANTKVLSLYKQACDGGHVGACYRLAYLYNVGKSYIGISEKPGKADVIYINLCDKGHSRSCTASKHSIDCKKGSAISCKLLRHYGF